MPLANLWPKLGNFRCIKMELNRQKPVKILFYLKRNSFWPFFCCFFLFFLKTIQLDPSTKTISFTAKTWYRPRPMKLDETFKQRQQQQQPEECEIEENNDKGIDLDELLGREDLHRVDVEAVGVEDGGRQLFLVGQQLQRHLHPFQLSTRRRKESNKNSVKLGKTQSTKNKNRVEWKRTPTRSGSKR